jgi:hypothetical protein
MADVGGRRQHQLTGVRATAAIGVAAIDSAKLNGSKGDSCRSAAPHAPESSGNDL